MSDTSVLSQTILHESQPQAKRVLLAVMAHPDDETFGTGGTLALYARRGVDVYLVVATRGEVGDVPPEMLRGYASVGDLREAELRCAAGTLGLKGVFFLGYRDSGMPGSPDNHHPQALAAQPVELVATQVAHYIRQLRPQVVITFDQIGGYFHPDHISIHKATVLAFDLAASPDFSDPQGLPPYPAQKLYFHTISRTLLRTGVALLRLIGRDAHKFGNNGDIDLAAIAEVDIPIHASIDYRPVAGVRAEAAACHASQGGANTVRGLQGLVMKLFSSRDLYMRAYPPADNGLREKDLFEGVYLD
jgi:N-acetyl-1-D-myo-inositol-2-amino-2-deoxy-alpha-D-glucopyranoside deacetylase